MARVLLNTADVVGHGLGGLGLGSSWSEKALKGHNVYELVGTQNRSQQQRSVATRQEQGERNDKMGVESGAQRLGNENDKA